MTSNFTLTHRLVELDYPSMPTAPQVRYRVDPRDVPAEKAARRLHLTPTQFEAKLQELQVRGFPAPDPTTGMYDLCAIDAWMDARSNLPRQEGLTAARGARNAREVFDDRARRLFQHGQG